MGEATITVDIASTTTPVSDQSITIITPENGTKLTGDMAMISGRTRKNSKISIKLNGQDAGIINSDEGGIFTKNITGLTQEDNILTASLLDGSGLPIANSPEIRFGRVLATASTFGVSISPASTVEASSPIDILIDATPGLADLSVSLDGTILTAKESTAGKYSIKTVAPQKS